MRDHMKALLIGSTLILSNAILPLSAISAKHTRGIYVSQSGLEVSSVRCQVALDEATNTVEEVPSVQMSTMDIRSLAEEYSDFPAERAYGVYIGIEGQAAINVLNSPQLLTSISSQLIEECDSVSMVKFAMHQTDLNVIFGLVGGSVLSFECTEPSPGRITQWGTTVCL